MTNREYVLEDIIDRLKYIIKYVECYASSRATFKEDSFASKGESINETI